MFRRQQTINALFQHRLAQRLQQHRDLRQLLFSTVSVFLSVLLVRHWAAAAASVTTDGCWFNSTNAVWYTVKRGGFKSR
jgi:hypothetical protein